MQRHFGYCLSLGSATCYLAGSGRVLIYIKSRIPRAFQSPITQPVLECGDWLPTAPFPRTHCFQGGEGREKAFANCALAFNEVLLLPSLFAGYKPYLGTHSFPLWLHILRTIASPEPEWKASERPISAEWPPQFI